MVSTVIKRTKERRIVRLSGESRRGLQPRHAGANNCRRAGMTPVRRRGHLAGAGKTACRTQIIANEDPPEDEYLYMRVWNRGGDTASPPAINFVAGTPVSLAKTGIQVTFTGTNLRKNDFWISRPVRKLRMCLFPGNSRAAVRRTAFAAGSHRWELLVGPAARGQW